MPPRLRSFLPALLLLGAAAPSWSAEWLSPPEPCALTTNPALCGTLEVLEDRDRPSGRRLALDVAVVRALWEPDRVEDPVVVIDGLPGTSMRSMAAMHVAQLGEVSIRRDLVFVEQRGAAGTAPFDCEAEVLSLDPAGAAACREQVGGGADPRFYGSSQVAADVMDAIETLGYDRVNLYATSYGTRVALELVRSHPARVRTATLIAPYPAQHSAVVEARRLLDRSLDRLVTICAADGPCASVYPDLGAMVDGLRARLDSGEPEATRLEIFRALRWSLSLPATTIEVPRVIRAASAGDLGPLQALARNARFRLGEIGVGGYLARLCGEDLGGLEESSAASGTAETSGFDRLWERSWADLCSPWPPTALPPGFRQPLETEVPILSLSGELDPWFDPAWGEALASSLPNALHLSVPFGQHQLFGVRGIGCVFDVIEVFVEEASFLNLEDSCLGQLRQLAYALP